MSIIAAEMHSYRLLLSLAINGADASLDGFLELRRDVVSSDGFVPLIHNSSLASIVIPKIPSGAFLLSHLDQLTVLTHLAWLDFDHVDCEFLYVPPLPSLQELALSTTHQMHVDLSRARACARLTSLVAEGFDISMIHGISALTNLRHLQYGKRFSESC